MYVLCITLHAISPPAIGHGCYGNVRRALFSW
jgi:hypothetical protein